MLFRAFLSLIVLVLASCIDNQDYDPNSVALTPVLAVPLASGTVTLKDLISNKDSAYLKVYPDGLMYFSYSKTFPSTELRERFALPDKNSVTDFFMPAGTLPASSANVTLGSMTTQIDFGFSPQKLSEILLKAGALNYAISLTQSTSPALPLEVMVTLTDVVDKITNAPLAFTAGIGADTRPLNNYIIKMIANKFNVKFDIVAKPHTTTFIPPNTKLKMQLIFAGMEFSYIKGFLGDQNISLPQQTIPITVFSASLNKSKVSFVEPRITMNIDDYYGVPCEITFSTLQAEKPGSTLALQITPASPFNVNFPTVLGNSAATALTVNNAVAVVAFAPTQLVYTANARINKGLASGTNFLTDSTLRVTMNTEVPLYGSASGVTLLDTMALDFGDKTSYSVTSSSLKIGTVNEMPLDAYIQLYLMDQGKSIIDSVFTSNQTYLVTASTVDGNGELLKANLGDVQIDISTEKMNRVFQSKFLVVKAKMNTARDANGGLLNVKFKSSYKLKITVGLLTKLNIQLK